EEDAAGEHVAASVDGVTLDLLGRHVAELSLEDSRLRLLQPAFRLCDPEVDQLHLTLEADEHVLRRDVAVHDAERPALRVALAVRMVERLADLRGDQADLRQRHRLLPLAEALHELPQVAPGDVLHGDVEALLVLAELQHLDDVRVRELDRDARLVHEHADELGVLAHGGKDLLDRQPAVRHQEGGPPGQRGATPGKAAGGAGRAVQEVVSLAIKSRYAPCPRSMGMARISGTSYGCSSRMRVFRLSSAPAATSAAP